MYEDCIRSCKMHNISYGFVRVHVELEYGEIFHEYVAS